MKPKIAFAAALAGLLALMIVACDGGVAPQGGEPVVDDEQALRQRAQDRWEAIIAGDYPTAYGFATPSYRATHDLTHFSSRYARQIRRTGVEVESVEFDPEDPKVAAVRIILHFVSSGAIPGVVYEGISPFTETWVKVDGQWWQVEEG